MTTTTTRTAADLQAADTTIADIACMLGDGLVSHDDVVKHLTRTFFGPSAVMALKDYLDEGSMNAILDAQCQLAVQAAVKTVAAPAPRKASKTCPLSRAEFAQAAKPLTVTIDGTTYKAEPKEFSTGSLGWNLCGKVDILVGGELVTCQIGFNLTAVGSKDLPQ